LILFALMLVMSESRTAWVVTAVVLSTWPVLFVARAPLYARLGLSILCVAFGLLVLVAIAQYYSTILEALGRDASLTGRIPLWIAAISDGLSRPWLGVGYRAYWLGAGGESVSALVRAGWVALPSHGHNAFLDIWLEL